MTITPVPLLLLLRYGDWVRWHGYKRTTLSNFLSHISRDTITLDNSSWRMVRLNRQVAGINDNLVNSVHHRRFDSSLCTIFAVSCDVAEVLWSWQSNPGLWVLAVVREVMTSISSNTWLGS
jgi:predicted glycosyl hydrolase (DUF1957 family)